MLRNWLIDWYKVGTLRKQDGIEEDVVLDNATSLTVSQSVFQSGFEKSSISCSILVEFSHSNQNQIKSNHNQIYFQILFTFWEVRKLILTIFSERVLILDTFLAYNVGYDVGYEFMINDCIG